MKTKIFKSLETLGLTNKNTRKIFSNSTRDKKNIKVWKDEKSGVIYIDDYFVGNNTYVKGDYHSKKEKILKTGFPSYERALDLNRRSKKYFKYVAGKTVLDFGCGSGDFLKLISKSCASVQGVELEKRLREDLLNGGILCYPDISKIKNNSIDTALLFHVFEHLPDPLNSLLEIKSKLKKSGLILIEIPHANDFLLSHLQNEKFKKFTLWSQHLILHTRESIQRYLSKAGFKNIRITGVQRYPLSNHLNWLSRGLSGGHKSLLAEIDTPGLLLEYENSLNKIDATDTLVALAEKF